jgi:hypothetical protein
MLGTLNCISASGLRTSFDYSALFKSSNSWLCAGHLRVRILDTDVLCSAAIPPSRLLTRVAIWGATPRTLEVGNKLGVTRERIRPLQNLALGEIASGAEYERNADVPFSAGRKRSQLQQQPKTPMGR